MFRQHTASETSTRRGGKPPEVEGARDMAVVFITGPVRSGKSAFGVRLARESGRDVTYVATAAGRARGRRMARAPDAPRARPARVVANG